ncbi:MAG: hypothetical protein R2724_02290 [Bryobacterales bacterium]
MPDSFVVAVCSTPVAMLLSVTGAPGMTAPETSDTGSGQPALCLGE